MSAQPRPALPANVHPLLVNTRAAYRVYIAALSVLSLGGLFVIIAVSLLAKAGETGLGPLRDMVAEVLAFVLGSCAVLIMAAVRSAEARREPPTVTEIAKPLRAVRIPIA